MAPNYIRPALSVKISGNAKKLEDRGAFFAPLKTRSKDPHPPYKPPRSHHQFTTPKHAFFHNTPQKHRTKTRNRCTTHKRIFLPKAPQPTAHPVALTADKDTEEKPLASNQKTAASLRESIYP
ncbi:hypothetical protein [Tunturiibacter gelidiferens]|uniref:hypothetical protein n=1 Tax=Tunturiibacter gelidiferens TaxID=3069689 RepID=UPI003D9ADC29